MSVIKPARVVDAPAVVLASQPDWPENVRQAAQQAAKAEIGYRLAPWEGRPRYLNVQPELEMQVHRVLDRYRDILAGYYWAVFLDGYRWGLAPWGTIDVFLVERLEGDFATNLELRGRFLRVGEALF